MTWLFSCRPLINIPKKLSFINKTWKQNVVYPEKNNGVEVNNFNIMADVQGFTKGIITSEVNQ